MSDTAIEALKYSEFPNSSDCISRQAAIDAMRRAKDKSELHRMLLQLPSAQPGWIPCSSALPEHDENVLICAKNYEDCKWYEELTARVCDCIPGETSTQVLEFGCKHGACGDCDMESQKPYWLHILVGWFSDGEWDGNGLTDGEEVVAWMPLPKPWEGGQS